VIFISPSTLINSGTTRKLTVSGNRKSPHISTFRRDLDADKVFEFRASSCWFPALISLSVAEMKFRLLSAIIAVPTFALAQLQDAPPLDARQLLDALKAIREQNEAGIKTRKQNAYQQVIAAAASGTTAAAFWKNAVKETQFEGADHQAAKLSDWRDGDGDALNSKECQNAARLHLYWLALSLQRSMGTETKTMLQNIIDFTKQIRAEDDVMARLENTIEKDKDKKNKDRKDIAEDLSVKRVHDQILRTAVGGSPVARWLQLGDLLGEDSKKRGGGNGGGGNAWEFTPGNVDGIFNNIILPEFRANKDPRLLEYWDLRIKQETERAAEKKLDVEQRDWTQIRRPNLLWSRTQDLIILGQKNRAITEMFGLLKAHPQHPSAQAWIAAIEGLLLPASAPAAPAPAVTTPTGTVPAPVAVPPATAPAAPAATGAPAVDPFRLNPVRPATQ
jgi:hypothetical protein